MMERTPEQVTADNQLEDAIAAAARAYDVVPEDEIVSTWVVAGATYGQDDRRTGYFRLYPGGVQPTHIAVGLLRMSERSLLQQIMEDDD